MFEIIGKILLKEKYVDTENILLTSSKFKVYYRPLFSLLPKCKKVTIIVSSKTVSLKITIKKRQQGIRLRDKKKSC